MTFESNTNPALKKEKIRIFFLTILVSFTPVFFIGLTDFYTRGEPREALIAQAMINTGDYILPMGYNDAIPSKPPLLHWLIVIFSKMYGEINEFTCRFPSLMGSTLFLVFYAGFLLNTFNPEIALLTVSVTALSFEWARAAVSCRVDMLHSASLAAGLIFFLQYFLSASRSKLLLTIAALTLSVLAKGPVSVILPAIIIASFCLIKGMNTWQLFKMGLKIFVPVIVLSLAWYLLAYQQEGKRFLDKFTYENINRFTSSMEDSPHRHGIAYLVLMLLTGTLPWSLIMLGELVKYLKPNWQKFMLGLKQITKKPYSFPGLKYFSNLIRYLNAKESYELFCVVSAAIIFIFYSIPSGKRGVYLLSSYPFLVFLLVSYLFINKKWIINRAIYVVLFFNLLFQAVIHPEISKVDSDKINAKTIGSWVAPDKRIYSFMTEFYGMSFYLNKRFYSLPRLGNSLTLGSGLELKEGDLIVLKNNDLETFNHEYSNIRYESKTVPQVNGKSEKEITKVLIVKN